MNNRHCHSLRSAAAVFPSSLPKLMTDLKKVTERGIEERLRRVRGDDRRARGGEAGKTTFNFSNGNIGFYDLLLMITTRREAGDTLLCILCDHMRVRGV